MRMMLLAALLTPVLAMPASAKMAMHGKHMAMHPMGHRVSMAHPARNATTDQLNQQQLNGHRS